MSKRVIGYVDKYPVVDLFPYKIKNVNNFLFRDHIPYDEDNPLSVAYAKEQWKRIVEGHWVYDHPEDSKEGTWVFMMPKLYFYANFGTANIEDEAGQRFDTFPMIWDNHWILGSYTLCFDGFSGFEDDPDITCNLSIKELEEGNELTDYEHRLLEKQHVKKSDGTYKKYVEAWEYLTNYYLNENPRPFPLGRPMYWNGSENGLTLASRKAAKSFWFAGADCVHEFITNGVREARYLDTEIRGKNRISIFVGTSDKKYLETFMTIAELSWRNVPGAKPGRVSPYFMEAEGKWDAERAHIVQGYRLIGSSKIEGSQSEITNAIIQVNKAEVVVSKRSRRIYIDEVGLVKNIKDVHAAAEGTLKAVGKQSGSLCLLGTGGSIEAIQETKEIAHDPKRFNVYSIPNYWKGGDPFCLFIPVTYTEVKYKNENGNTDLLAATKGILADRYKKSSGDLSKITKHRQNFPLIPEEMFIAGKSDYFARDIITDRIQLLGDKADGGSDLWKEKVKLYDLELGLKDADGIFEVVPREHFRYDNVIKSFFATETEGKTGELCVYEPPMPNPTPFADRNNVYKIVLDPVTDKEKGRSYVGIIVYKGYPTGRQVEEGEIINNIVAVFKGRRSDQENKKMAMLLCLWYKGKLQYENNTPGTHDYFYKHGLVSLLQLPPWGVIKNITQGTKVTNDTGVAMNHFLKGAMLREFKAFHTMVVRRDDGGRSFLWVEDCYDLALLHEMNMFSEDSNTDLISAMLILMLWHQDEYSPIIPGDSKQSSAEFKQLAQLAEDLHDSY